MTNHIPIAERGRRNGEPRQVRQSRWTEEESGQLADMIANGKTFGQAAMKIGRTRNSCIGHFNRVIRKNLGWQAR